MFGDIFNCGRKPVFEYLLGLSKNDRARIYDVFGEIKYNGLNAQAVFRQIDGKLWELKISQYRLFYVLIDREEMVLLHAYKKQGRKLPLRERDTALNRMREILL
ncbi:MAG: type II toxin-antitoxin system RelE/ParE family toxin [Deltaproteobacteria bacterium]|nr:type II toxin-antitoxin system RelE/ParE family toxin [Deltaproteobacteria bacterium]